MITGLPPVFLVSFTDRCCTKYFGLSLTVSNTGDVNIDFANAFQDYCLNLEAMLISKPEYDRNVKHSVAERVFFKWLKEMGGIRWQTATSAESNVTPRFREQIETLSGSTRYYQVVQYIGSIDVVNNVQNNVNAYTEVYIHVPSNDGRTPLVLFKSEQDVNYYPGMVIRNEPIDPLDIEYIYGRHYSDTHPAGLSNLAIFDQDVVGAPVTFFNTGGGFVIPGNWFDPLIGPNAYFTDDDGSNNFDVPTDDWIQKTQGLSQVTYHRSRLDGVGLDFDPASYKPITDNPSITTIDEFNSTVDATPFEFNCILVYYDKYDPHNPTDSATNLYGVLFLEDLQQDGIEYAIPSFAKYIPDVITNINGNSYGFKINLKFDTSIDNVGNEKAINDFSSFSMDLFIDVMNTLQTSANIINDKSAQIDALVGEVADLRDQLINLEQWEEIDQRITVIETSLSAAQTLLDNSEAVNNLINGIADDLNELVLGRTSLSVSYNIDAVKQGDGITIDRSIPNQVKVHNANQMYNILSTVPYEGDLIAGGTLALQKFNNYFRHYAAGLNQTAASDIYVEIDDTVNQWQAGQTFRISFEDVIEMDGNSLVIVTDAPNRLGGGNYGIVVATIPSSAFDAAQDRPIIDIYCVDPVNLVFVYDQIR